MKLSGAYLDTVSGPPGYADVSVAARAYAALAPDRMVWGSDWPHVGIFESGRLPQYGMLLDWLYETTSDPILLKKILVENPARFYGLPPGQG